MKGPVTKGSTTPSGRAGPNSLAWLLVGILSLSNVALLARNRSLRADLVSRAEVARLEIGEPVPNEFYSTETEQLPDRRPVILFLSSTCRYCRAQMPYWKRLSEEIDRSRYYMVVLAPDNESKAVIDDYLLDGGVQASVLKLVPSTRLYDQKFRSTPMTVALTQRGAVDAVWYGRWYEEEAMEAASYFELPPASLRLDTR